MRILTRSDLLRGRPSAWASAVHLLAAWEVQGGCGPRDRTE